MSYLLDTNAVIAILNGRPPIVRDRFQATLRQRDTIAVSSIVLFELWYGIGRGRRQDENAQALRMLLAGGVGTLAFDDEDAQAAGNLRATLESAGRPIGPFDTLIAGQAIRRSATLVTANARAFARVPGLVCQDWTR